MLLIDPRANDFLMKTSELNYELPADRIAQRPCEPRDAARMMIVHRADGRIEDSHISELPKMLRAHDCLVLNRTRVLPAKFAGRRATGGKIGGLFVEEMSPGKWRAMLSGAAKLKPDEPVALGDGRWTLTVIQRLERGLCEVRVQPPDAAHVVLESVGSTPLPPYIRRDAERLTSIDPIDRERYQTVYAAVPGAVAAPTAGLHFTESLLRQIRALGVNTADVVLHVGLGTFQPVEVEDLGDHPMHKEWYEMPQAAVEAIHHCRKQGGRVIAVGTTSVRVLETAAREGIIRTDSGWTDLLIYPPYQFHATDALLTNFHLPGSTLLALVSAFAGRELIQRAYQTAIEWQYRFYSYGDAMLII